MNDIQLLSQLKPIDPYGVSHGFMLTVVFPKSKSKNYSVALAIASQADATATGMLGDIEVTMACFSGTDPGAKAAKALIECVSGWKGTMLLSNGSVLTPWYDVVSVLNCYLKSCACRDPQAHCVRIIDDPMLPVPKRVGYYISSAPITTKLIEIKRYAFPCSHLLPEMRFQRDHPSSPADQIQAVGVDRMTILCPRFNPDGYELVGTDFHEIEDE